MKRMTALFLGFLMTLGLAACGSSASSASSTPAPASSAASSSAAASLPAASSEAAPAASANTEAGSALVVYFSATGNTAEAAGYIADATGADLFELVPVTPYTDEDLNWTDEESRVSTEHNARLEGTLQTVELTAVTPENWDSYDVVFIGYPIWWGEAAWPVDAFIQANDFSGKTVIPFCTSSSSGLGESGALLAEMAGTGDWLEGQRFRSSVSESDVQEWLSSLDL